jgi:hypothetical protein
MDSVTIKLRQPVKWGKEEVTELVITPNARFFRDVELTIGQNGSTFKPYALALAGVAMAGISAGAATFVDRMHPADMNEVAQVVISFLAPDPKAGSEP